MELTMTTITYDNRASSRFARRLVAASVSFTAVIGVVAAILSVTA